MNVTNYSGFSNEIVQNLHSPKLDCHSRLKAGGCKCQIITPAIQQKIAEFYNNPDNEKRHVKALKNYGRAEVVRKDRHEEHQSQRVANLFGNCKHTSHTPVVTVYEAKSEKKLPGKLVKSDKIQSDSIFVNEAFYGAKNTLAFWMAVFKRNSYDDKGADLISSVGIKDDYDNAYWNGKQMFYGKGDVNVFTRFTIDQDIITHEMTHAMTGMINDLVYEGQSGAINEHFSDVLGIMAKQYFGGKGVRETFSDKKLKPQTVDESNWLIGDEVLIDKKGKKYALRSMEKPGNGFVDHPIIGTDDQPDSAAAYVKLPLNDDNGGVHKYSGFLNRAFCLAAKKLGGFSWDHVGLIWYDSLFLLSSKATFIDLAKATIESAEKRFGANSKEVDAVRYAWATVSVFGQ
jgi:Zn-dependent metalloprotease